LFDTEIFPFAFPSDPIRRDNAVVRGFIAAGIIFLIFRPEWIKWVIIGFIGYLILGAKPVEKYQSVVPHDEIKASHSPIITDVMKTVRGFQPDIYRGPPDQYQQDARSRNMYRAAIDSVYIGTQPQFNEKTYLNSMGYY